jgi:T5SS/PEP-CTERM-associated repeat protein/autotransporter-associated beta strand protein
MSTFRCAVLLLLLLFVSPWLLAQNTSSWIATTSSADVRWSDPLNWQGGVPTGGADQLVIFGSTAGVGAPLSTDSDLDIQPDLEQIQFLGVPPLGNVFHVRDDGGSLRFIGAGTTIFNNANTRIDPNVTVAFNDQTWLLNNGFDLTVKQVNVNAITLNIDAANQFNSISPALGFDGGVIGTGKIHITSSQANLTPSVAFNAASSFTGGVSVDRGFVAANADDALGLGDVDLGNGTLAAAVSLTLGKDVRLDNTINLNGPSNITIASFDQSRPILTGPLNIGDHLGGITIASAGGKNAQLTISGGIQAALHGTDPDISITGNVRLNGVFSTYHGATNVSQGTLEVDTTLSAPGGASPVTINSSATLAGTGEIDGRTVTVTGRVDPGTTAGSTGVLTIGSNLGLSGTYHVDLPGDQLIVKGNVGVGGNLEINPSSTLNTGQLFTIIDNQGAASVSGTFANFPQASPVAFGNHFVSVNYTGGDGNDVVLGVGNPFAVVLIGQTSFIPWAAAVTGDYSDATNWNPQIVPNASHGILFDLPATSHAVNFTSDVSNIAVVARGQSRSTLDLAGHKYTLGVASDSQGSFTIAVGTQAGDNTQLVIRNGSVVTVPQAEVDVGRVDGAVGTLTIANTGASTSVNIAQSISGGGSIRAGVTPNSTGIINVVAPSASTVLSTANLIIGDAGHGELHIAGHAEVDSNNQTIIGNQTGATGIATVDGSSAQFFAYNNLLVGPVGNGTLQLDNSAYTETDQLTVGPAGVVILNSSATLETDTATIVQSGGVIKGSGGHLLSDGTLTNSGTISPGLSPGTLTVTAQHFIQDPAGVILLEIAGTDPALIDHLVLQSSNNNVQGTIRFLFLNGFLPRAGDQFNLIIATGALDLNGVNFDFPQLAPGFTFDNTGGANAFTLHATSDAVLAPEPSLLVLLTAAGLLIRICPRRRKCRQHPSACRVVI